MRLKHNDYTVGWISALPLEKAAAIAVLDEVHPWKLPQKSNDHNTYTLGTVHDHNVVLACLPDGVYGTTSAAVAAAQMLSTFPSIRFGLMVGIGGGAPSEKVDLRLGDIVVSKPKNTSGGVIQYDYGKMDAEGSFHQTGHLNKPPTVLLTAIAKLQAQTTRVKDDLRDTISSMTSQYPEMSYPGEEYDTLYAPEYNHHARSDETCSHCDRTQLVLRTARATNDPEIHYGLIASGNQLMQHTITRDQLARALSVICFEMESAGLMDHFPCLVIRGICDYSDSHKNDKWQRYAAATAAAYAKQLLCTIPGPEIAETVTIRQTLSEAVASLASSFISISESIMARVLEARSPTVSVSKVLTDVEKQLPLMAEVMERLQKECRTDSNTGAPPSTLLSAVKGGLEQIRNLKTLIHETLPTQADSTRCRLSKSLAMYRKRKDMMDILRSLDEYKHTLTLYLAERHAALLETVKWQNMKSQCHKWLSPCDTIWDQIPRVPGTCQWIWAEQAFLDWMRPLSDTAGLLCIYGIRGCGKSVLAHSIITDLDSRGERTLFFSFSGSDGERQTLDSLARSLLWQLFNQISSPQAFEILDGLQGGQSRGFMVLFQALVELAKLVTFQVFCIIDGIDECTSNDQASDLFTSIRDLLDLPNFHVALVGRRYALEAAIAATSLKIEVSPSLVRTDIERFIQHNLKDWALLPLVASLNIPAVLRDNSEGVFLWVKLMVNELRKSASIAEVTERLRNLPCELEQLYEVIFARLSQSLDKLELRLARKVFDFTITSFRALTVEEMNYACALATKSKRGVKENLLVQPENRIGYVCGGLVHITNGRISLVHISVKEFLTSPERKLHNSRIRVDLEPTHQLLGTACIRYLITEQYECLSADPGELFENRCKFPFLDYASRHLMSHLALSGPPCASILEKLESFFGSSHFATWVEHVSLISFDDLSVFGIQDEIGMFRLWLRKGSPSPEASEYQFEMAFEKELKHRAVAYGDDDPRTERWRMFYEAAKISVTDNLPASDKHVDVADTTVCEDAVGISQRSSDAVREVLRSVDDRVLPLPRQVDLALRLTWHLARVRILTDPLQVLFETMSKHIRRIPVFGLIAVAAFFIRFRRFDDALNSLYAARDKVGDEERPIKFNILEMIGHVLVKKGEYKEAVKVRQEAAVGRAKVQGENHKDTLLAWDAVALAAVTAEIVAEIAALEAEKAEIEAEKAAREAELAARGAELAAREAALAATGAELAAREAALAATGAELAATGAELAAKGAELAAREAEIAAFKAEKAEIEAEKAATEAGRAAREAEIAATEAEKAATEAGRAATESELAATKAEKAATKAEEAATEAGRAATEAEKAAIKAEEAATEAGRAATESELAATEAEKAAIKAEEAATEAGRAATEAEKAATEAEKAAIKAEEAATEAGRAATEAEKAATEAEGAATESERTAPEFRIAFLKAKEKLVKPKSSLRQKGCS